VGTLHAVAGRFVGGDSPVSLLRIAGLGGPGDLGRGLGLATRRHLGARGRDRPGIDEQQADQEDGGLGAPA